MVIPYFFVVHSKYLWLIDLVLHRESNTLDWDLLLLTPSHVYGCCPTLSSPFPRLNSQEKLKRAVISYKLHHYSSVRMKGFHHQMTPASDDTICPRISISGQGPETPSAINTSLGSRFRWPSHELQLAPNLYAFKFPVYLVSRILNPIAHESACKSSLPTGTCVLNLDKQTDKDKIK